MCNVIISKSVKLFVGIVLLFETISCKKLAVVDSPYTRINSSDIFTTDATAASVVTGLFTKLSLDNSGVSAGSLSTLSINASLSADEMILFFTTNSNYILYYTNTLKSDVASGGGDFWNSIFPMIFKANAALEGLNTSTTLTESIKKQLIAEAKFVRAFCNFYLVNLYGDIPLPVTTDYKINASLNRSPKSEVYKLIIDDLKDAQASLSESYLKADALTPYLPGSEERVRPTKWAATALLARVYLYTLDYVNAEIEATKVLVNTVQFGLESVGNVFLKNNKEAIWQLYGVGSGTRSNTGEGRVFILPASGPSGSFPIYLSDTVVNSFEPNDLRRTNWVNKVTASGITYNYPFKYKIGAVTASPQEYSTVIRLAEIYLIRAEARARLDNLSGAISDLDIIRNRASLPLISITNPTIDKSSLLGKIMHERQVELFTEWGHRWFDLKRTGIIDQVMIPVTLKKGGTWQTTDQLYPIPQSELNAAPQLTQNPGY